MGEKIETFIINAIVIILAIALVAIPFVVVYKEITTTYTVTCPTYTEPNAKSFQSEYGNTQSYLINGKRIFVNGCTAKEN